VPNGNVDIGDAAATTARTLSLKALLTSIAHDAQLFLHSSTGNFHIMLRKNNVEAIRLVLGVDGTLQTYVGAVYRPMPFAVAAGYITCTPPAANTGVGVAITFPVNRFTVVPSVATSSYSGSGYGASSFGAMTTTGMTVRLWNPTSTALTSTAIHWHAIQMTPTVSEGFSVALPEAVGDPHTLICHTEGCPNADHSIELIYEDNVSAVHCGPCSRPITDIDGIGG